MMLSSNAKRLFDYLPQDCSTVGGITIRKDLDLSPSEYKTAKEELKEQGLVVFGRGRGGSVARVEGTQPEEISAPTPQERMAMAREMKQAKARDRKETHTLIDKIVEHFHKEGFPQVEHEDVSFSDGRPIVAVWEGKNSGSGHARMHTIPQLDYDKLQAVQR